MPFGSHSPSGPKEISVTSLTWYFGTAVCPPSYCTNRDVCSQTFIELILYIKVSCAVEDEHSKYDILGNHRAAGTAASYSEIPGSKLGPEARFSEGEYSWFSSVTC